MKKLIAVAVFACLSGAAFAQSTLPPPALTDPVLSAQREAKAKRQLLFVEFQAPWCYSCYYMATNVLNGEEWTRVRGDMVRLDLDADSPDGSRWMQDWKIQVLPTFVLLDSEGRELGRIVGEQTRRDFYTWLFSTRDRGETLEGLKAKVVDDKAASLAAAQEVLRTFHARYDAEGGLAWYTALAPAVRTAVARDNDASNWIARLELMRAAKDKESMACAQTGEAVLSANLGCERPYELGRYRACTAQQTLAERGDLLRSQVELMRLLFEKRVLGESRCADERSIVLESADLYQVLGDPVREAKVLDLAIADVQKRIAGDLKKDRNLSDNLRVYLDRAGKTADVDALLLKLIDAYPDDYVYAYRFGKSLAARGRHAEALKYFELAAPKAYGVNRLRNAELRARTLISLSRKVDAWKVIGEALQDNGPWFPDDAARLLAIKAELSPSKPAS